MTDVIPFPGPGIYFQAAGEAGYIGSGWEHLTPSAALEMGRITRQHLLSGGEKGLCAHQGLDVRTTLALLEE